MGCSRRTRSSAGGEDGERERGPPPAGGGRAAWPFVEVGDTVKAGQVLCIIEAMKLMNEIEAEVGGVVVKRFVSNAQPVEYGEKLFAVKPGA